MNNSKLSIPDLRPATGGGEVRPKDIQAWLASLPLADSAATSQQLYKRLFDLNRHALDARDRLELMELYSRPVETISAALQGSFANLSLPLPSKAHQLAEFLRQLHTEMAYGYKSVIRDLMSARNLWSRKAVIALPVERAIHQLGEVLLRSYQVYMPYPAGVWREIHTLYRLAEKHEFLEDPLSASREDAAETVTVRDSYLRAVLLGLCGPYQLPQNECFRVNAFLFNWADKASVQSELEIVDPVGHFLIDLSADSPAMLIPRDVKLKPAPYLRILSTIGLARTVHELLNQLKKGEPSDLLRIGSDCVDSSCVDMLRRMVRFWGLAARRQYSRRSQRASQLSVCVGLKAVHFFSNGQKPFAPPSPADQGGSAPQAREEERELFVDLNADMAAADAQSAPPQSAIEMFRTDRWRIRDESAGGISLMHLGRGSPVRIGDLLGIQGPDTNLWRVGVARWLKSPGAGQLEMGVEMLAPDIAPVAVMPANGATGVAGRYVPALRLDTILALHQPATLIVERGLVTAGDDLDLADPQDLGTSRRVRILNVIERTGSFEQVVFADVMRS